MTTIRIRHFIAGEAVLFLLHPGRSFSQQARPNAAFELQALAPEFWELIDHRAGLETMGTGFGFTEGPVWDPAGFLTVSDEETNVVFHLYPDGRREKVIALGDPDGNTYDRQHRLIVTASVLRAIIRLSADGKSYEILADNFPLAVTNAGVVTQRLSATRHGENTTLNGTFSTFIAGNLTAIFMSGHGTELSRYVLREVHPEENVVLDDHVPFVSDARQVVVKLFDVRGEDHGILDKANIETPGSVSR